MTFLELCRFVHLVLRVGEESPGTQPVTVADQKGVLAEIVQHVNSAYRDVMGLHHSWLFLRVPNATLPLPAGANALSKAQIIGAVPDWHHPAPFVGADYGFMLIRPVDEPGASEQEVRQVPIEEWYGRYDVAPIPEGQPSFYTLTAEGGLEFDTLAERAYTMRTAYSRTFAPLVADGDQPVIPEQYRRVIAWWAIARYYCISRDKTNELKQKAEVELRRELNNLRISQLPSLTLG